jgi:hypothetical protein
MSSLSTLHREYAALMALPYFDFYEGILRPKLIGVAHMKPDYIQKAMTSYKVNEPQAIAILNALRADGFVLIQGYALASHCLATTDSRSFLDRPAPARRLLFVACWRHSSPIVLDQRPPSLLQEAPDK